MKKIYKGQECKDAIAQGVNILTDTVKVTLGPGGKNVLYSDPHGRSMLTKDGIAVAEQVSNLKDEAITLVANTFRQACKKTAAIAGDGTTSTAVLGQALIQLGLKSNLNAKDVQSALESLKAETLKQLESMAVPCNNLETIRKVALISSNGDEEVTNLIVNAIDTVGNDGVITIDDSLAEESTIQFSNGFQVLNGYLSPYFTTDDKRSKAELNNPLVFVTDSFIENTTSILAALSKSAEAGRPLFIIAPKIAQEVIDALVVNHVKGTIKVCAVKLPPVNDIHESLLDICAITGATLISERLERKLTDFVPEWFGKAEQVTVHRDFTVIRGTADPQQRAMELREEILDSQSAYQTDKLNERIAKLTGCIAVIKVGGVTDVERIERKARVEDALQATKAAIKEGTVPGGGWALYNASVGMENEFKKCLREPQEQLRRNLNDFNFPLADVIDPLIVVKQVVTNAVSIAQSLLSTEVIIVDKLTK